MFNGELTANRGDTGECPHVTNNSFQDEV